VRGGFFRRLRNRGFNRLDLHGRRRTCRDGLGERIVRWKAMPKKRAAAMRSYVLSEAVSCRREEISRLEAGVAHAFVHLCC